MTTLFIAVQRGVYRHDIVGAASTLERAQELGRAAIEAEPDHYHDIEIVKRGLDGVGSEVFVGRLSATAGALMERTVAHGYAPRELLGIEWSEEE